MRSTSRQLQQIIREDLLREVQNPRGRRGSAVKGALGSLQAVGARGVPGEWLRDGSWAGEDFTVKLITHCRKIGLPIGDETGVPYEITEPEPKREEEVGERFDNSSLR